MNTTPAIAPPIAKTGDQLIDASLSVAARIMNNAMAPAPPPSPMLTNLNFGNFCGVPIKIKNAMYPHAAAAAMPPSNAR
jgi:hypothetical protein